MTRQKGKWVNTNGNVLSWTNWSVGQPNNYQTGQDYAAITFNNKWSDYSDWAMVNVVCQQTLLTREMHLTTLSLEIVK